MISTPKKVLAIDDSLALRLFISKTLAQSADEFEVVTAKDGAEGLNLASSGHPDLILLDFILPDMNGDAVCERLVGNPVTALIPVVLMSSNAGDIKRTEARFKNVTKAIAKPFTPDLLTQTVRYVARSTEFARGENGSNGHGRPPSIEKSPVVARPPKVTAPGPIAARHQIVFSGRSDFFPLYRAFTAVQQAQLTGALVLQTGENATVTYFHHGRPVLTTTQDAEGYVGSGAGLFDMRQVEKVPAALQRQAESGKPVFVSLAMDGVMDDAQAASLCRAHGAKYLSRAWTAGRFEFEFQEMECLPELTGPLKACDTNIDDWMLESLRHVGDDALSALAWGDLGGVPIYTRHGYERIQNVTLNREEANFLGRVGTSTLAEIATAVKVTPERAQQILFRFLSLEIFEYWPAAILRGEV